MTEIDTRHWQSALDDLSIKHDVAGAALGILHRGEQVTLATGHANRADDIAATPDTLFQIGSITKVWTATLVMQLVDEGKLALTDRAVDLVPGLQLPDPAVTVQQLLNHTSGIDGDHFLDTGRGDDCLERYAASLADLAPLHPTGAVMSYCNSGFSLLGRIIEVADERTWDASTRARLIEPLGMTRTVTLPEDALRFRTATGHVRVGKDEPLTPVPVWGITRSAGPAGLVCAPVGDLLRFARLHLDGGRGPDGDPLVSESSATRMLSPSVECPERWLLGSHIGLSWLLDTWSGRRVVYHGGTTLGQNAYLRLVPDADLAIGLLTNGGGHANLAQELFSELLLTFAGVSVPERPVPSEEPIADPTRFVGTFRRVGQTTTVTRDGERLLLRVESTGPAQQVVTGQLHPFRPDVLLADLDGYDMYVPVSYLDIDGRSYMHALGRITPRS